jgi:hypothetical protein
MHTEASAASQQPQRLTNNVAIFRVCVGSPRLYSMYQCFVATPPSHCIAAATVHIPSPATGPVQVPTTAQVRGVSAELARRATLPPHVKAVLEALPVDTHPMTQFITMITALQVGRGEGLF